VGRLEDIIERNRNPSEARKREAKAKAKASAIAEPRRSRKSERRPANEAAGPAAAKREDRLRDIVERNQNPGRGQLGKRIGMTAVPIILLVVLLLLIFTNLAERPDAPPPAPGSSDHKRVNDIRLWTPPAKHAGSAAPR
jgi:hypothetical protein